MILMLVLAMSDDKAPQVTYSLNTTIPTCTAADYALSCGVSVDVVKGWIKREYIPVVRFGKYTFINLSLLAEQLKNT